jgi:hypothetical protein
MSYRVPPALSWLAKKRAHLAGELQRLENQLDGFLNEQIKARQHQEPVIATLAHDLRAVDAVFALHEIQVDPESIAPVRPKTARKVIAWGKITRGINRYLATLNGAVASTREVAILRQDSSNSIRIHGESEGVAIPICPSDDIPFRNVLNCSLGQHERQLDCLHRVCPIHPHIATFDALNVNGACKISMPGARFWCANADGDRFDMAVTVLERQMTLCDSFQLQRCRQMLRPSA